jgi:hypothetical protein
VRITLERSGENYAVQVDGAASSTTTAISTGWLHAKIHVDATANASYVSINGGSNLGFTRANVSGQYLIIGKTTYSAQYPDIEVGYATIN